MSSLSDHIRTDKAKKNSDKNHANQENGVNAVIRSLSKYHRGKTYAIGKKPVIIGRNILTCKLHYRTGTPGVSGIHCSVSYDEAKNIFILKDLGSKYGTYLMDNRRISPNTSVRLKPGTCFYVGDKLNVCRVEVSNK